MKKILNSILLTTLVAIFCGCAFVFIGLLLNFWNETIINCLTGLLGVLTIGGITYGSIDLVINNES